MSMSWGQFTSIPNGTRVLNHGWDQCVALANLYHESVIGGSFVPVGSAFQWWTQFGGFATLTNNYVQSSTPVAGAIFVARYGIYDAPNGHIGVVTGVNSNGTFNTMEQNAGTWRYVGRYTRGMANVLGFLIPRNNPAGGSSSGGLNLSATAESQIAAIYAGLFGPENVGAKELTWASKNGVQKAAYGNLEIDIHTQKLVSQLQGQVTALTAAVKAIPGGGNIDMAKLEAAAKSGAEKAISNLTLKPVK